MSRLQHLIQVELDRRLRVLPDEVHRWRDLTQAGGKGWGIHLSQLNVLRDMFAELELRQSTLAHELKVAPDDDAFAWSRARLERELCGSQGLMAVFQVMLAQRNDAKYRPALDAADLVSADCYKRFTEKARLWGVLDEAHFREPPLTYLNAHYSPAAFTRRHAFGAFKMPLDGYNELKLPLSVLSLPFGHTAAFWTFCTLYHEVGHPLDHDLQLANALEPVLKAQLETKGADEGEQSLWRGWLREMVADAVGVLLGGPSFVRAMTHVLLLPPSEVLVLLVQDPHPNPFVRVFLLGALLRCSSWPDADAIATEIENDWKARYPMAQQAPELRQLTAHVDAVATCLLQTVLPSLNGHALLEFSDSTAADAYHINKLSLFLRDNGPRPDPENPLYPLRLVPAAAQASIHEVADDFAAQCSTIHERALAYIPLIPHAKFMPGLKPERQEFLRQLTRDPDFSMQDA